jgi:nucleoside-diphosphate-sugar epimerase
MRIFLAGAGGAIGRRLTPLLVEAGHAVAGTTRRSERAATLRALGARPVVLDVRDAATVREALLEERPDVVIHQLTDLSAEDFAANGDLRVDGTRNLVEGARAAGVETMVAQSIAWLYAGTGAEPATENEPLDPELRGHQGVAALEAAVATMPRGVILRNGLFYGPGTWYAPDGAIAERVRAGSYPTAPAWSSFIHVDDAARAVLAALGWPAGAVNIVDDEPATSTEWLPIFSDAVGGPSIEVDTGEATGRAISNAMARRLGWHPARPTWRTGFFDQ